MTDARIVGTSRATIRKVVSSSGIGVLIGYPLTLLVTPLVLGAVSKAQYGIWATLSSLLALGGLADVGVRTEVVRRVAAAHGRGDDPGVHRATREGLTVLLLSVGIVFVVAVLAAGTVVDFVLPAADAAAHAQAQRLLLALAALVATGMVVGGFYGVLGGLQRGDVETWSGLAGGVVAAGMTAVLAVAGHGIWALYWGAFAGGMVGLFGPALAVRRLAPGLRPLPVRMSPAAVRGYLAVSALVLIPSISNVIDFQFDKVVLARYVGPEASADYQLGTMLVTQLRGVAIVPLALLLAGVAELRQTDRERMRLLYRTASRTAFCAGAVLFGGVVVLAPAFFQLWLGPGYPEAGTAAQLLAVAMAINLVTAPWYFYAIASGWHVITAWSAAANCVVNCIASWSLTLLLGLEGALLGSILGNVAGAALFWVLLRRRERRPWLRDAAWIGGIGACLTAAAAAGGVGRAATSVPAFVLAGAAFAAAVLGAMAVTRLLDVRLVLSLFRRDATRA